MVSTTMRLLGSDQDLPGMKVKAILAEFDSLPQFKRIYQYRNGPNVLMLLGNTLGNLENERPFLDRIYRDAMMAGDLFVLEVNNQHTEADPERGLATSELSKRFDFGPLDMLGVPYESEKVEYDVRRGRSAVEGTQTVAATYNDCTIGARRYTDIALAYIHRYDPAALGSLLSDVGFDVLRTLEEGSATAFLLQKPG